MVEDGVSGTIARFLNGLFVLGVQLIDHLAVEKRHGKGRLIQVGLGLGGLAEAFLHEEDYLLPDLVFQLLLNFIQSLGDIRKLAFLKDLLVKLLSLLTFPPSHKVSNLLHHPFPRVFVQVLGEVLIEIISLSELGVLLTHLLELHLQIGNDLSGIFPHKPHPMLELPEAMLQAFQYSGK